MPHCHLMLDLGMNFNPGNTASKQPFLIYFVGRAGHFLLQGRLYLPRG